MQTMTETTDGFVVAQRDLELRGAGDVLGQKQSGLPDFKVGDPVGDLKCYKLLRLTLLIYWRQKIGIRKPIIYH